MSYFKPNTKKAMKLAIAVKGLTASLATMAFIHNNEKYTIIVLIAGAIANEAINFLSDDTKPRKKNSND
jgi:hypothetical protein